VRVSCIIPTANRRKLLPLAVACFLDQSWEDKELVVIDDGDAPESDLVSMVPRHIYARVPRMSIGAKRNLACQFATGDIIVHFDSDDWSAPTRVHDQVERLVVSGKQMSGYHTVCYWNLLTGKAYKYLGTPLYSLGTAMCYTREFWKAHPFADKSHGEDNDMVYKARDAKEIISADGSMMLVVRVHETNVTQASRRVGQNNWPEVPRDTLPALFFQQQAAVSAGLAG
jgi:glycosyltransferase involved in cell wall biosynthesis